MIKNLIFDLDGTLLDTSQGIIESVQYTADKLKMKQLTEKELRSFIGPPLKKSFIDICNCTETEAQKAVIVFRSYYQNGAVFHARPYDGIEELCRRLCEQGIRIGVATNKPQRFAVPLIQKFGLDKYIDPVCGADEEGKHGKTDLIRQCISNMGGTVSETVLVGDTENDANGAQEAGVGFIAVTYGFGFKKGEKIVNSHFIGSVDDPIEIFDMLRKR